MKKLFLLIPLLTGSLAAAPSYVTGERHLKVGKVAVSLQTIALRPPSPAFDSLLRSTEEKEVASATKDSKDYPGKNFEMTIGVDVKTCDAHFCSLLLEEELDFHGAHPGHLTRSILFDRHRQRGLILNDIFRPRTAYLQAVAAICQKKLRADGHAQGMWASGAAAKPKNYSIFYLKDKTLVFVFDFYQVAPYSDGPQEVEIPLADLRPLLAPAFLSR